MGLASAVGAADVAADVAAVALGERYQHEVKPLLATYCAGCHNLEKHKGDLDLGVYAADTEALRARKLWKQVATKVADGDMPPEDEAKQPSAEERQVIRAWTASLKTLDHPDAGPTTLHRLNRGEYRNSIRDLLGLDYQAGADFPKDDVSDGFDNIAETLSLSPFLMEKYLVAADDILERALLADSVVLRCGAGALDLVQNGKRQAGRPDGKQRLIDGAAELATTITVASAGDHVIAVRAGAERSAGAAPLLRIRVDGKEVHAARIAAPTTATDVITCTVPLAAGERQLTVIIAGSGSSGPTGDAVVVETVEVLRLAGGTSPAASSVLI
ncbi:MAG: DUF1587 domain-containing protein, partial [Planctomycetes bacterium]|nr:DUF1587 domain-containing protein [Planctomycetota bacterium]